MVHPMQDWLPIFALGHTPSELCASFARASCPESSPISIQNSLAFLMLTSVFG